MSACRPGFLLTAFLLTSFLVTAFLVLPLSAVAQAPATEAELARIVAAINEAKAALNVTRQARSALSKDIENQERQILSVQQAISRTREDLQQNRTQLAELQSESLALEQDRSTQQNLVAAYLEQAWKQGEQPRLKLLLNQEDLGLAARMMRYHQYFAEARTDLVAQYTATLARLDSVASEIQATQLTLSEQELSLTRDQATLQGTQQTRQEALASLDADLQNRDVAVAELEMQRVEIEVLLAELARSVNELTLDGSDEPFTSRKGKLPWPVKGTVTRSFGSRHDLGDLTWEGLTIATEAGADIRAVHNGRVIFADWFGNSGLLLIIDHGDGYMSLYAHNQELYRSVGQWVSSGEVVAAAGNTGGQRESGLYFEVRLNGTAQNPLSWLSSSP